jgi:hypothetical protein
VKGTISIQPPSKDGKSTRKESEAMPATLRVPGQGPNQRSLLPFVSFSLLVVLASLAAPAPLWADEDWKLDVVHLKTGRSLEGLLVKDSGNEIFFRCIRRKPGVHTVVIGMTISRSEIKDLELLDEDDRAVLTARVKALDASRGVAVKMASLELKPADWGKNGKGRGLGYESAYFNLTSNASEDIVRRSAFQLEQIYGAYARFLPPRKDGQATAILLAASQTDYQMLLKDQGKLLLNPAFYDVAHNQIVCGTDLARLGERLERARKDNQQLLQDLKEKEAELQRLYKGKVPPAFLKPIKEAREEAERANKQGDELFEAATRQLFRTLYHEAFHAYLANFVYPPSETEVPRWLNEGLAQIFETCFVEGGELRVGHADKVRLERAQATLRKGELVSLVDLLESGPKQFVVLHASDLQTADRHYLTSWALAFYLTFDRKLLGTKAMDNYVHALHRGVNPREAFGDLVGEPLPQFEKEFRQYLPRLRPDGSLARSK